MARHWLRGLWIGAIVGLILFLVSFFIFMVLGVSEINRTTDGKGLCDFGEQNCRKFLCSSPGGGVPCTFTEYVLNPFQYLYLPIILILAIIGSLIGLAFKKKKR